VHAFSLINEKKERVWVKYHLHSQQEIQNLTTEEGIDLAGKDPDSFTKDMINSIRAGDYPKWKMYIQVMTEAEAEQLSHDPFDITKVWTRKDFPLIEVGDIEFNRIPENYFQDVEQVAFSPANIVPGMGYSPDRLLQGRLFAYRDAHNYRLGINGFQLPVNQPKCPIHTYHRDGALRMDGNGGMGPTYEPNSFGGPQADPKYADPAVPINVSGPGQRYENHFGKDDFMEARAMWQMFEPDEQERVIKNITMSLKEGIQAGVNSEPVPEHIQQLNLYNMSRVDDDLGQRLATALGLDLQKAIDVGKKTQDALYSRQMAGTVRDPSRES
jgi:catalase